MVWPLRVFECWQVCKANRYAQQAEPQNRSESRSQLEHWHQVGTPNLNLDESQATIFVSTFRKFE